MCPSMEPEKETLKFKTVTDGLGFHPFADGLPYAPHSKVHAGGKNAQHFSDKAVSREAPRTETKQQPVAPTPTLTAKPTAKIQPPVFQKQWIEKNILVEPTAFYGFKRFFAFVLDTLTNLCMVSLGLTLVTEITGIALDGSEPKEFFILSGVLFLILNHTLITLQELLFNTSFGKHFIGLKFEAGSGRIFARAILFPLSILPAGLGILYMFFDPKKRMLHDLLSGAQPIEK